MNTKRILVVTDAEAILKQWADRANGAGFETCFAANEEKAIELAHQQHFDVAVVNEAPGTIDFKKLAAVLPILQEDIELVQYQGEEAESLDRKLASLFAKKRHQRIKQLLILDSSWMDHTRDQLPSFSAN